jgi:uncharacterized membrane protein YvbJ
MSFCANCGSEIKDLSQNFCEKCGSSIPASVKEEKTSSPSAEIPQISESGKEIYDRPGGLFDLNRNYYILKEK